MLSYYECRKWKLFYTSNCIRKTQKKATHPKPIENSLLSEISHPNLYIIHEAIALPSPRKSLERKAYASPLAICSLNKIPPEIFPKERIDISLQLITGLQHLHQNGLIHQDLKPDNFFLFKENSKYVAQIADCDDVLKIGEKRTVGSLEYLSPEDYEHPDSAVANIQSEIFSMGESLKKILLPVVNTFSDPTIISSLEDILEKMTDTDPSKRPSLSSVISTFQEILRKLNN